MDQDHVYLFGFSSPDLHCSLYPFRCLVQCTDDRNERTKKGGIKTFNGHLDGYKKLNVLKLSFANSFLEGKTKGTDVIPISKVDSGICTGK